MDALKRATAQVHARQEGAPFFAALREGRLPLESCVGQLRALSMAHAVIEDAPSASDDPRLRSVWSDDMRRLPLLQQDMACFASQRVADIREAGSVAFGIDDSIRRGSIDRPLGILGPSAAATERP